MGCGGGGGVACDGGFGVREVVFADYAGRGANDDSGFGDEGNGGRGSKDVGDGAGNWFFVGCKFSFSFLFFYLEGINCYDGGGL